VQQPPATTKFYREEEQEGFSEKEATTKHGKRQSGFLLLFVLFVLFMSPCGNITDMRYRRFGRTGWEVSEIGYGMWGMASWSNSSDDESLQSLQASVDHGCNFFDTAYAYGNGRSEHLLGQTVKANPGKRLYTATKIPPKDLKWPALAESTLMQSYPPDQIGRAHV